MRDRGILLLRTLQFRDAGLGFTGAQESKAVIDAFTGRIRREVQGLLELVYGLGLSGGVLVESLAQVSEVPEAVLFSPRGAGGQQYGERRGGEDNAVDP